MGGQKDKQVEVQGADPQTQAIPQAPEEQLKGGASAESADKASGASAGSIDKSGASSQEKGQEANAKVEQEGKDKEKKAEKEQEKINEANALVEQKKIDKEKLMEEFKAETDSTIKFKKLEELAASGNFSDMEISALQEEIEIEKNAKRNLFEKAGASTLNIFNVKASSAMETVAGVTVLTTGAVAIGLGLRAAYRGIKGWISGDKKEETEKVEQKDESWFKGNVWSFMKKAALFGFGGFVLVRILMGVDSIEDAWRNFRNRFSKNILGQDPNPEDEVDKNMHNNPEGDIKGNTEIFAQDLDPIQREQYNTIAGNVNKQYMASHNTNIPIFGGHDFDIQKDKEGKDVDAKGMIPRVMTIKYGKFGDLAGEYAFFQEFNESNTNAAYEAVWKRLGDKASVVLKSLLGPLYTATAGWFNTDGSINDTGKEAMMADEKKKELVHFLIEGAHAVQFAATKGIEKYKYQVVYNKLIKADANFASLDDTLKIQKVKERLTIEANNDYLEGEVTKLLEGTSAQGLLTLDQGNCINGEIDLILKKALEENQKDYDNITGKGWGSETNEKGEKISDMDIIKAKIDTGEELDETEKESLLNICNRRDDAIEKFGDEKRCGGVLNFLGEYAPLVEGNEEAINEHIKTETNRYAIVEEYKTTIKNIQTKIQNNEKITPEDVNGVESGLEEYNKMTTQIVTDTQTALSAEKVNGSYIIKMDRVFARGKSTILSGFTMVIEGGVLTKIGGLFKVVKGTVATATGLGGKFGGEAAKALGFPEEYGVLIGGMAVPGYLIYNTRNISIPTIKFVAKNGFKLGVGTMKLGRWMLGKTGLKSSLASIEPSLGSRLYPKNGQSVLVRDVVNGKLSLNNAASIAGKKGWMTPVASEAGMRTAFLEKFIGLNKAEIARVENILTKYPNAKYLREKILYQPSRRNFFANKYTSLNDKFLTVIESMDNNEYQYMFSNGGRRAAGFTSRPSMDLFTKEECANIIAKNGKYFKEAKDFKKMSDFLSELHKAGKINTGNAKIVLSNLVKDRKRIGPMDSAQVVAEFDDLKLASNLETKVAAATKRVLESLRDLKSKLSRYMFRSPQVASTVEEIAHAEQVVANPEAMSAASSGIGPEVAAAGGSMSSESKAALKGLSGLIKGDKAFAQALSKAKTPELVRKLLGSKGISGIGDDVVEILARTSNGKIVGNRILDKINYLANFEELGRFQRFLQNPATRVVGRVLGKLFIVGGVFLGILEWINANAEAREIEGENYHLADEIREEGMVHGGVIGVGGTLIGAGLTMAWNPGGWVLLGVGAVTIAADILVRNYYASEKARAYNKSQFIKNGQGVADNFILENIFYPDASNESLSDRFKKAGIDDIDHKVISQTCDATDAKILLEIYKLHPLAIISCEAGKDDDEIATMAKERDMTETEVSNIILDEKKKVKELYDKAREYIQQIASTTTGTSNGGINEKGKEKEYSIIQNLVGDEKDPIKAMHIINAEVGRSLLYAQHSLDTERNNTQGQEAESATIQDNQDSEFDSVEAIKELVNQESTIKSSNQKLFDTMESLYKYHPYQFMIIADKTKGGADTEGNENIQWLQKYMIRKQASTGIGLDMMRANYSFNPEEISQMPFDIEQFTKDYNAFQTMKFTRQSFQEASQESRDGVCIDDKEITNRYHISENPIDNIMYRYATEVLGIGNFQLTNDPYRNDAEFEKHFPADNIHRYSNGVYREGGKWRYNYNTTGPFSDRVNPLDNDGTITDLDSFIKDMDKHYQQMFNSDKSGVDEKPVDTYKSQALKHIAYEEKRYQDNKTTSIQEVKKYLEGQHLAEGEYIALPIPFIIKLARSGIWGVGNFVYSLHDAKIEKMDRIGSIIQGRENNFNKKSNTTEHPKSTGFGNQKVLELGQGSDRFDGGK